MDRLEMKTKEVSDESITDEDLSNFLMFGLVIGTCVGFALGWWFEDLLAWAR